ncbi:MAG: FHA domain-containing protein, partial [Myxococcales bacterium]|nr:FHA domain-containing protein [Myxococcales bacterium]
MARLLWRDAQSIEGSLDLAGSEIKVGRAVDCAIRTDDAMVSRHHARVFWGGGGYIVEDLGSANGVYFQEQQVKSHLLKHGDAIRCGSLWLRFVDTEGASAPAASQSLPSAGNAQAPMAAMAAMEHSAPALSGPSNQLLPSGGAAEADAEIRVLRRRVEQLQTELRIYRTNRFNQETARRMEDLENDLSMVEIERDNLKSKLGRAEEQMAMEAGSVKVKRALEITALTAETSASLNDLLSSLRIEVMAAEGEFEQFSHQI